MKAVKTKVQGAPKIEVSKMPVCVTVQAVEKLNESESIFKMRTVANLTKAEKAREEIKKFLQEKMIRASEDEEARKKFNELLRRSFIAKPADATEQETKTKAETKAETKTDEKPAKTTKTKAKQETKQEAKESKEAKEKIIERFPYMQEMSKAECLPLTPDNAKVVDQALKFFEAFHVVTFHRNKLTKEHEAVLTSEEHGKAVESLINRSTLRLLIIEHDDKNRHVASYLLKPVYMSPYSITCVCEAHNATQPEKSMYVDIINTVESPLPVYDVLLFAPHRETLTTQDVKETKNKLEWMFVNVRSAPRQ